MLGPALRREGPWLVGGALRRALANEPLGDFDLQAPTEEMLDPLSRILAKQGFTCAFANTKTDTWWLERDGKRWRADISKKFNYPDIAAFFRQCPFTICQFVAFFEDGRIRLAASANAFPDLLHGALVPVKTCQLTEERWLSRLQKYERTGFRITSQTVQGMVSILRSK